MGLAISTGFLADMIKNDSEGAEWFRAELQSVYDWLEREGLELFEEPETQATTKHKHTSSFPYSFIHYLRRAQAWINQRPDDEFTPVGSEGLDAYEDMIVDETMIMYSHLLCHSDANGFYVPVRFPDPLFAEGVTGEMVGSSYQLHDEMIAMASFLGIELDEQNQLSEFEAKRVLDCGWDDSFPFFREYTVWLALFEVSRQSIEHGTMIVFH